MDCDEAEEMEDTTLEEEEEEEGEEEEELEEEEEIEEDDDNETDIKGNNDDGGESEIYLPGKPMEEGEELTFDKSAYKMYHAVTTGAPCLSFDIIPDDDSQVQ